MLSDHLLQRVKEQGSGFVLQHCGTRPTFRYSSRLGAKKERAIDEGEQYIRATPADRSQPKHECRRKICYRPEDSQQCTQSDQRVDEDRHRTRVPGESHMAEARAGHHGQGHHVHRIKRGRKSLLKRLA